MDSKQELIEDAQKAGITVQEVPADGEFTLKIITVFTEASRLGDKDGYPLFIKPTPDFNTHALIAVFSKVANVSEVVDRFWSIANAMKDLNKDYVVLCEDAPEDVPKNDQLS